MTAVMTAKNTRKSVPVNLSGNDTVTLTFTLEELAQVEEAMTSLATSWQVEPNTPKGKARIHWSKKDFIVDGRFLFIGGKAKHAYKTVGKTRAFNKFVMISELKSKVREALALAAE